MGNAYVIGHITVKDTEKWEVLDEKQARELWDAEYQKLPAIKSICAL